MTSAEATARPVGSLSLPLAAREVPSVSSDALLRGARELVIRHQGGEYRLRLTRNDKLILTK
ncbi:hemin uptake protein HemP [Dyella sp. Sa]|uniref:Hemin uptake protein HemP n=2 Tax=Dyella lutea TaxID=2950441 RepID=A0ABT1F851_9GAMM|nr:hemin uptake protein HemP [Dyella lutea]MCP1373521.1 hemin uptake protein HemP [Dyella lutea]